MQISVVYPSIKYRLYGFEFKWFGVTVDFYSVCTWFSVPRLFVRVCEVLFFASQFLFFRFNQSRSRRLRKFICSDNNFAICIGKYWMLFHSFYFNLNWAVVSLAKNSLYVWLPFFLHTLFNLLYSYKRFFLYMGIESSVLLARVWVVYACAVCLHRNICV